MNGTVRSGLINARNKKTSVERKKREFSHRKFIGNNWLLGRDPRLCLNHNLAELAEEGARGFTVKIN